MNDIDEMLKLKWEQEAGTWAEKVAELFAKAMMPGFTPEFKALGDNMDSDIAVYKDGETWTWTFPVIPETTTLIP